MRTSTEGSKLRVGCAQAWTVAQSKPCASPKRRVAGESRAAIAPQRGATQVLRDSVGDAARSRLERFVLD